MRGCMLGRPGWRRIFLLLPSPPLKKPKPSPTIWNRQTTARFAPLLPLLRRLMKTGVMSKQHAARISLFSAWCELVSYVASITLRLRKQKTSLELELQVMAEMRQALQVLAGVYSGMGGGSARGALEAVGRWAAFSRAGSGSRPPELTRNSLPIDRRTQASGLQGSRPRTKPGWRRSGTGG